MKVLNSIKWRLQLWYGLILVAVLAGFGATAYQLERNQQFRRVEDELHRRVGALAQQLHGPRGPQSGRPGRLPPDRLQGEPPPLDQPPEEGMPDRLPPLRFGLTPQLGAMFDPTLPENFYFIVRGPDDRELGHSDNAPKEGELRAFGDSLMMAIERPAQNPPAKERIMGPSRTFQHYRLLAEALPSGEKILVGCSAQPELHDLRLAALRLTGIGGIILVFGLAGGWWFVGRALRPVVEISSTAAKISAGDLAQRINTAETESELGQLAAVLNSTFARLEMAFAQQKQFASDAAHELRTPVAVILTQTQMALSRERDAAGYKQTVEACQRAAQRMRKLIETLLELARFDAGQEVLKRLSFDFSKTVSDSVELVQTLAEEKQVTIFSELEPLEITGDPERLSQVVTNLLTNAIQYNQLNGSVNVKLACQNGLAVLEIADSGKGIAPEDLPRVFERFYRADKSRTGNGNSGLGLSICKAIIEAHGGTIEVSSELGVGTSFTVRLPG